MHAYSRCQMIATLTTSHARCDSCATSWHGFRHIDTCEHEARVAASRTMPSFVAMGIILCPCHRSTTHRFCLKLTSRMPSMTLLLLPRLARVSNLRSTPSCPMPSARGEAPVFGLFFRCCPELALCSSFLRQPRALFLSFVCIAVCCKETRNRPSLHFVATRTLATHSLRSLLIGCNSCTREFTSPNASCSTSNQVLWSSSSERGPWECGASFNTKRELNTGSDSHRRLSLVPGHDSPCSCTPPTAETRLRSPSGGKWRSSRRLRRSRRCSLRKRSARLRHTVPQCRSKSILIEPNGKSWTI